MRSNMQVLLVLTALCTIIASCGGSATDFDDLRGMAVSHVKPDRTYLRDEYGRYVMLRGVNVGGSSKVPYTVDPLTYIGRPFPLAEADKNFKQIKAMGFNSIRLLFMWEAVEPDEKGVYNEDFLKYFDDIIGVAEANGLYVLINMHENLFSRHLYVYYNENTDVFYVDPSAARNSLIDGVLAAFPQFNNREWLHASAETLSQVPADQFYSDRVTGDGAPLWAVKACLPEKADYIGGRTWGAFRPLGQINNDTINTVVELMGKLGGDTIQTDDAQTEHLIKTLADIILKSQKAGIRPLKPYEANDLMPLTFWGLNGALSLDIERCYASFFAGDKIYPNLKFQLNGKEVSIKEYFQDSFTNVWIKIAEKAKNHKNVIGYDIMNEPMAGFIVLTAAAAYFQSGLPDTVRNLIISLLGPDTGKTVSDLVFGLQLLPPIPEYPVQSAGESETDFKARVADWEAEKAQIAKDWGFDGANLMEMLNLNYGFDKNYLQPIYERVGKAIQDEDPNAVIWIEEAITPAMILGGALGGQWEINMTKPEGIKQVVFSPHWYPDIYPTIGFNVKPREFTAEEVEFRDYTSDLQKRASRAKYSLGNIPIVYGEFGTYFNYNGIDWSVANNYSVSEQILDNYYEAFEGMNMNNILWCYTSNNDKRYGDWWNKEDFSVLGFDQKPRAEHAYNRPHAKALSGKPVSTHFYSDLHYYDPDKGIADPLHEFVVEFKSKETNAPTEIYVPKIQYPEGFYVWLSDGYALFDSAEQTLYFYPTADAPEHIHKVIIKPPQKDRKSIGWRYFFKDEFVLEGTGGAL